MNVSFNFHAARWWFRLALLIAIAGSIELSPSTSGLAAEQYDVRPLIDALGDLGEKPVDEIAAARELNKACTSILDDTPTLSPREQDWLREELKSRPLAAYKSVEGSKHVLRLWLGQCAGYAGYILKHPRDSVNLTRWLWICKRR